MPPPIHAHALKRGGCAICHTTPNDFETYTCYLCHRHNPANTQKKHLKLGIDDLKNCAHCHPNGRRKREAVALSDEAVCVRPAGVCRFPADDDFLRKPFRFGKPLRPQWDVLVSGKHDAEEAIFRGSKGIIREGDITSRLAARRPQLAGCFGLLEPIAGARLTSPWLLARTSPLLANGEKAAASLHEKSPPVFLPDW